MHRIGSLSLTLALVALPAWVSIGEEPVAVRETIIAGGDGDFMTVRHLEVHGSQRSIGSSLAKIAAERHGWSPQPAAEEQLRQREAYFRDHAPAFHERFQGVADQAGVTFGEGDANVTGLSYGITNAGCSVAYYPPETTEWGGGVVSRNYDFTTGTFRGNLPAAEELPVTSQPYVLETHPEDGYATLSMCAYNLLGGVLDGMNEQGLTIALLADDEVSRRYESAAYSGPQPGFGVLDVGRHLLETCANVAEAKSALRASALYYSNIPCHYLVADRFGDSFVWENAPDMQSGFVFDGNGEPQLTTNFMLQLHPDLDELPAESHPLGYFNRFRTMRGRMDSFEGKFDLEFIRETNRCVSVEHEVPAAPRAVSRTLWHTLYFPEERRMEVNFYLGEGKDGIRRSEWVLFRLEEQ